MRKFTTQILSLLTALSFASALSAQTVGDIGAEDNATGGDKLGLTVEGYFLYGLNGGSGTSNYENGAFGSLSDTDKAKAQSYIFSGLTSIGGGLNVGYEVAPSLDVVAGFKFNSYSTSKFKLGATNGLVAMGAMYEGMGYDVEKNVVGTAIASVGAAGVGAGITSGASTAAITALGLIAAGQSAATATSALQTSNYGSYSSAIATALAQSASAAYATMTVAGGGSAIQQQVAADMIKSASATGTYSGELSASFTSMNINLGLRPKVKAWGGEVYAGAGLNIALPQEITQDVALTGFNTLNGAYTSATIVNKFGTSIGVYGELGYNYDVMPNLYVGLGLRTNFNTGLNDGNSKTVTFNGTATSTFVSNASMSFTEADKTYTTSGTTNTNKTAASSFGLTDAHIQLNVGYRL
jgi:hypothetical protein